jgi:hypothetical protein
MMKTGWVERAFTIEGAAYGASRVPPISAVTRRRVMFAIVSRPPLMRSFFVLAGVLNHDRSVSQDL